MLIVLQFMMMWKIKYCLQGFPCHDYIPFLQFKDKTILCNSRDSSNELNSSFFLLQILSQLNLSASDFNENSDTAHECQTLFRLSFVMIRARKFFAQLNFKILKDLRRAYAVGWNTRLICSWTVRPLKSLLVVRNEVNWFQEMINLMRAYNLFLCVGVMPFNETANSLWNLKN
jgi:hypothetical protein